MKINPFLKWVVGLGLLVLSGLWLINHSVDEEKKLLLGYESYHAAEVAVQNGDYEAAYSLYLQSSNEFRDPQLKGVALYEAATVGWIGQIADYENLVALYQQSLRLYPAFYEASFDLEYLYQIKANSPGQLPQPDPGPEPSTEGRSTSGDI